MSDETMIRVRRLANGQLVQVMKDGSLQPIQGRSDWARLEAMTEEEIEANAASDPDNPPFSDDELARLRPVPHPKRIRQRLGLTQEEFAARFHLPLGTLRDWEQGARTPGTAARTLLRVIDYDPEFVARALEPAATSRPGRR